MLMRRFNLSLLKEIKGSFFIFGHFYNIKVFKNWAFVVCLNLLTACIGEADKSHGNAEAVVTSEAQEVNEKNDTVVEDSPSHSALGQGECQGRPDVSMCCEGFDDECEKCRQEAYVYLEKWRKKCLPEFSHFKDCSPGAKIAECCGDDRFECKECREKAVRALSEWRFKCGSVGVGDCQKSPKDLSCCQGADETCVFCRERQEKLLKDWKQRCDVKIPKG